MHEIKCLKCGIWNQGGLYCSSCGNVIAYAEEQRLKILEDEKKEAERPRDSFEKTMIRWKEHRWWILRVFYRVAYGTSLVFGLFAALMAWMAALVNA